MPLSEILKTLTLSSPVFLSAVLLPAQTFQGVVSRHLSVDTSIGSEVLWDKAAPKLALDLDIDPSTLIEVFRGDLKFGKARALDFGAALCLLKNGEKVLFVDLRSGSGALNDPTRIPLTSPSQPCHLAEARFNIPVPTGPFSTAPAYVALPKSTEGYRVKPNQVAMIVGDRPFVTGSVILPHRKLKVRYSFDLDTARPI